MRQDELGVRTRSSNLYWKYGLPTVVLVVAIILGFVYFSQVIAWTLAGLTIFVGTIYGLKTIPPAVFNGLIMWERWRQERIATTKANISQYIHETKAGVLIVEDEGRTIKIAGFFPAVSASKPMADIPQLPPPSIRKLLDVDWTHMLITGPTGVGKSTVACWLIDSVGAVVYVLDPHASQNARKGLVWPGHAIVVGDGRDWLAIDSKLVELLGQMDTRYRQSGPFSPVLIVSDEWLSVRENCEHAGEFFETIGSEARKVDMQLLIMTVAATVDDLKCSAAVRDNLVQLRLDLALKAQNRGELKWGKGNVELVELPGRYKQLPARADEPLPIEFDEGPSAEMPPADELELVRLIDTGASKRAAYEQVYGVVPGGRQYDDIDAILHKFGRV